MQKLTPFALTDVGRKRDHNEDAYVVAEEHALYVVCDGMGGHASGEVASRLTTEHMVGFFEEHGDTPQERLPYKARGAHTRAEALLSNAVQYANDRVYVEGMKDSKLEGMGTTLVAMLAQRDTFVLAHVGDSRIYRWYPGGELEQVTRDHSLLNHKIDAGELSTVEEIANFKQGNIIVRAVGLKDYVEPEVQTIARRPGDVFLMCSDGLSDMVDDWSMQNVLEVNADDLQEAAGCLVRMANDRGGKDNITVMLVRVDDEPAQAEEVTDPGGRTPFYVEDTKPSGVRVPEETLPVQQAVPPAAHRDFSGDFDADDAEPGFGGYAETTDPGLRDDDDDFDPLDRTDVSKPAFLDEDLPPDLRSTAEVPPPSVAVEVRSGTARVGASTGDRAAAPVSAPTRPSTRRRPSVIVEEPSIIVDDSLRKR
ncbi:MAG: Stp1/IreP family PP2C-type Ser/Thr phosphatase [Deltaproteobacteria bacterium]|nr:Stp1/IreP family PP2C-type Ser/Thr phosphatase [Deltaproteobacteria bacterium]MCB9788111.1 Stp1/IreP family PP2C-type Ser/Thr phosphatase [Deltaproteobacteria bacterium]